MKRRSQISAAFLVALALLNLGGTIPSATAADEATGALGGRVLSVDSQPIAGATVSAYISDGDFSQRGFHPIGEPVKTDPKGRFLISKLYANNDYLLHIEVAGYERKWTDWMHVRSGVPEPVAIRLREAPASVAGKVVDAQGSPVAKARVQLRYPDSKGADASTETDAEGTFRIDGLFVPIRLSHLSPGERQIARQNQPVVSRW